MIASRTWPLSSATGMLLKPVPTPAPVAKLNCGDRKLRPDRLVVPPVAMLPVVLAATRLPALVLTLKFKPMLRAAARLTSATVTRNITCCSPGIFIRLTMFGPPAVSQSSVPRGGRPSGPSPGGLPV